MSLLSSEFIAPSGATAAPEAGLLLPVMEQFYTIQGKQGRIVSIKTVQENNKNPELMRYAEYEDVTVRFDAVSWTYTEGGITHEEKR